MGSKNVYERFAWFHDRVKSGRYPNATKLSKKFEVSAKTAQRDIEFMRDRLSAPFQYDKTEKGYFYEEDSFYLPLTYLSSDELTSLLLAKKMLQDTSSPFIKNDLNSIVEKISGILKKHSAISESIDKAFSFELIQHSPVEDSVFKNVLGACVKKKRLDFTYYAPSSNDYTDRTVDPYHLLNYMGTCYLIAHCHLRDKMRSFVLGRISNLKVLDTVFTIKKDFDIKKYLHSSFGIYKGKPKEVVKLRFSPKRARWVKSQKWHRDQKTRVLEDGSLELSFPVASFFEIEMEVLKHGAEVEVVSPESFRELIKSSAQKILEIY
ncbi:MAG: WYL domain-containing protein [Candidatus Mariimomonas ferrooxydans]